VHINNVRGALCLLIVVEFLGGNVDAMGEKYIWL
jgi:hypothetical protein